MLGLTLVKFLTDFSPENLHVQVGEQNDPLVPSGMATIQVGLNLKKMVKAVLRHSPNTGNTRMPQH